MHAGRGAQVIEGQARATFGTQLIQDARQPLRSLLLLLKRKPCREARDFSQQAFDTKWIYLLYRREKGQW